MAFRKGLTVHQIIIQDLTVAEKFTGMSVLKSSGNSATKVSLTYYSYFILLLNLTIFFLDLCVRPVAEVRPLKIVTGLKRRHVGSGRSLLLFQ